MQLWRSVLAIVLLLTASVSSDQTRTATVCNSPGFVALNGLWAGDGRVRGIRTHRQGVCEFSCNGTFPLLHVLPWPIHHCCFVCEFVPSFLSLRKNNEPILPHEHLVFANAMRGQCFQDSTSLHRVKISKYCGAHELS